MSSIVNLSTQDVINIVFLILETFALCVFIYFVSKYTSRFKDSRDPYTIISFMLIIMALTIKILFKSIYMAS